MDSCSSPLWKNSHSQEEGIDYDETFTPVARMEAIRIFLAFATYMNFKVYQIDVKSAFLNDKLKEEVYVKQPPGFENSEFPNYACKLDKAFYRLKQAPKACPICKILVQSKGITSNSSEKNTLTQTILAITWTKKALQVPVKYLVENWFVGVPRNNSHWLCPQLKRNMLDHILKGDIELHFIPTEYQLADIFTKPLDEPTFTRLKVELGMEFWSTDVAFDLFSSIDEPEKRPLKEFLIKFSVLNGQRPLTLDFNTFCSSTSLNYNNGKYVDHPTPEGPGTSGALFKKSKRPKSKKPPIKTMDITSTTLDEDTAKTTPHLEGSLRDKDSGGNIPPADMEPIHTSVADPLGTGAKYQDELEKESDEKEVLAAGDDMDEDPQDDAEVRTPSPD
ncbi:retrovirus-related pol polyprotein from transposon TNT 1-94 [Tanacetum coccineum]